MLTVEEAAVRLGVSKSTVYALVAERKIGHSRRGLGRGRILFSEADIEAYERSCHVAPDQGPSPYKHVCVS